MALFTDWKLQRISLWNWVWHNLFNFWKLANPVHDYRCYLGFLSFLGSIWAIYISQGKKNHYIRFSNFAWSFKHILFYFLNIVFICFPFTHFYICLSVLSPFFLINIDLSVFFFFFITCHRLVLLIRSGFSFLNPTIQMPNLFILILLFCDVRRRWVLFFPQENSLPSVVVVALFKKWVILLWISSLN